MFLREQEVVDIMHIGDMAILVEGYNHKKCWKLSFPEKTTFLKILQLYPSLGHHPITL